MLLQQQRYALRSVSVCAQVCVCACVCVRACVLRSVSRLFLIQCSGQKTSVLYFMCFEACPKHNKAVLVYHSHHERNHITCYHLCNDPIQ